MKYFYIKYDGKKYYGLSNGIRISEDKLELICSLFEKYTPSFMERDGDNLNLGYDDGIIVIENYQNIKDTFLYKYFKEEIDIMTRREEKTAKVIKKSASIKGVVAGGAIALFLYMAFVFGRGSYMNNNANIIMDEPVGIEYASMTLDYPRSPNLINQMNMINYTNLANIYGGRFGIDPNVILAVMAENNLEHTYEVNSRGRIGIMNVPYERVSSSLSYYDYVDGIFLNRGFSLDELTDMGTNIEAWCALFQNYLYGNNYNIMVSLELMNEDYHGAVFNAISSYTREKYGELDVEDPENYYYKMGVSDFNDLGWLSLLMNDDGKVYSEEVLSYLPSATEIKFKSLDNGVRSDDISISIGNNYKQNLEIKNT